MDNTSYVALSRQLTLERQMAVVAGNIANMNTHGFKTEHLLFEEVLERAGQPGRVAFVQDVGLIRDLGPGALETTGNPLDLAINGEGYFTVETPAGPRFTRGGHFSLDGSGALVTSGGHRLLDAGGAVIQLPPGVGDLSIARDGTISTDDGVIRGRSASCASPTTPAFGAKGDSLLMTDQVAEPVTRPEIAQGRLERSNVQPILEMTRMMETVRAFQNTQRLLETHHEMVRRVIDQAASG
jgi:flagellar basal-body rod protein FlgF